MAIVVEIQIQDGKVVVTVGGCGKEISGGLGKVVKNKTLSESASTEKSGGAPPANDPIGPGGGGITAGGVTVIGPIVICSPSSTAGGGDDGGAPPANDPIGPGGGPPDGTSGVLVIGPIVIGGAATPAPPPPGPIINEKNL